MRRLMVLGIAIFLMSAGSFVKAQNDTPNIDPSKVKFLKTPRCGEEYTQPMVAGVVASDIDLCDDDTAKNIIELARTFVREKCPSSRDFLMMVYLWRGDPATFNSDRFNLNSYPDAISRKIGEAYKESNNYGGWDSTREAVKASGRVVMSVDKWSYENKAKIFKERQAAAAAKKKIDDVRIAQEKLAAEKRAKEWEAAAAAKKKIDDVRIAQEKLAAEAKATATAEARRKRKAAFEQKAGKVELLTDIGTFCTNPFPWKSKVGATDVGYIRMVGETDALVNLGVCEMIVSGFPNAKAPAAKRGLMSGYPLMFVAFRFLTLRNGMPVVQYVYTEACTEDNCREFK